MTSPREYIQDVGQGILPAHAKTHEDGGVDTISVFPIGSVIDWYGTLVNGQPPYRGWHLADGTVSVNGGTPPDLRDRITEGAGTTYALGNTRNVTATAGASVIAKTAALYKIIRVA